MVVLIEPGEGRAQPSVRGGMSRLQFRRTQQRIDRVLESSGANGSHPESQVRHCVAGIELCRGRIVRGRSVPFAEIDECVTSGGCERGHRLGALYAAAHEVEAVLDAVCRAERTGQNETCFQVV